MLFSVFVSGWVAALLAPGPLDPALGAIVKAQAAQAGRAHKVTQLLTLKDRPSSEASRLLLVVAPPDRFHQVDPSPSARSEVIKIGDKVWTKDGTQPWKSADPNYPFFLENHAGPVRADDWALELREAKALGSQDLQGVRTQTYLYAVGDMDESSVRMWVAEATGLPVRYEQAIPAGLVSWQIEYDRNLRVEPPAGETAPPSSPLRPTNYPRLTLARATQGSSLDGRARRLPMVVLHGGADAFVGVMPVHGQAAFSAALRSRLEDRNDEEFLLYAGHDARWSEVARALDTAREAGATRVALGVRSVGEGVLRATIRSRSAPAKNSTQGFLAARPVSGSGEQQMLSLNNNVHPFKSFEKLATDVFWTRSDKSVDVSADGDKPLQDVVLLMDLLARAGGEIVLTTPAMEPFAPTPPPPPPPPPPPRRR